MACEAPVSTKVDTRLLRLAPRIYRCAHTSKASLSGYRTENSQHESGGKRNRPTWLSPTPSALSVDSRSPLATSVKPIQAWMGTFARAWTRKVLCALIPQSEVPPLFDRDFIIRALGFPRPRMPMRGRGQEASLSSSLPLVQVQPPHQHRSHSVRCTRHWYLRDLSSCLWRTCRYSIFTR